jgi:hypothetical protein
MDALEKLAEQLTGVILALKDLARQAKEAIASAQLAEQSFIKKAAGLTDREVAVLERENAVAMEAKKWEGFGDIVAAKDQLANDKSSLENERRAFEKDRSARQAVIDQGEADVRAGVTSLRAERAALEKEKAEYKQKFLEEMKKKMG